MLLYDDNYVVWSEHAVMLALRGIKITVKPHKGTTIVIKREKGTSSWSFKTSYERMQMLCLFLK